MNNLISSRELEKEIKEIEGFDVKINCDDFTFFPHYPYNTPCPDDWTVDDFKNERLNPLLSKCYSWEGSTTIIDI